MDFNYNNFADEFCKFSKEVFAGNDEKRKEELQEIMQTLMNSKTTSFKRPIEDAYIAVEAKRRKLTVSKVPNEIWIKILSYMKNKDIFGSFALVNKHFHNLSLNPSAVKYLHIQDIDRKDKAKTNYKKWLKVVKRSRTMVELKIKAHNDNKLDWHHLILETLKCNQSLKSLILFQPFYERVIQLSPSVVEALKLAKNLQHFQTESVDLSQEMFDALCNMKSLKRLIIGGKRKYETQITPDFVERLAHSNNPIEYFSADNFINQDVKPRTKALNILFEKKKHTLTRIVDNFGLCSQNSWYGGSHEHCQAFPNFSPCKNLEEFCGLLHLRDLALISDLPNLKTLILRCPDKIVDDANFLKQFHHMNFSNLKYLELRDVETNDYDGIFRELAKTAFPLLVCLSVSVSKGENDYKPLTETTVEYFIKNTPSLKSIVLDYRMSLEVQENFILKILKEANVIIVLDYGNISNKKKDKMFEKKAGPVLYEKFLRMKKDSHDFKINHVHDDY